ncbi:transmembrane protein [Trifolium pratense]|uniref:Transmembrane protein n=1 Tax=Trifolium pratense TaxID=57577 RepID=A0A2K3NZZ8_TRIPR|nr:transmembrane protein [Trifolium pratense]
MITGVDVSMLCLVSVSMLHSFHCSARFFKFDIPPWFSAVSIALNSDVDLDVTKIERVPKRSLPIICFRDGSPPLPDALNTSLKYSAISGINGLDTEQCFPMEKNITMKLTNELISPGAWYIGLFNGIGDARTQSRMIIRGTSYSFSANISVEACTNSMMRGEFCNSTVNPLSCTTSDVYNSTKAATLKKPTIENAVTCKSNFETLCVQEGVPNLYSLDINNVVEELTITAENIRFNITPSSNASNASDVNLLCFARHGAIPANSLYDYSSDLNKAPLVIRSPLIGRWYISVLPVNLTKKFGETHDGDVKVCYSLESQMLQCPLGKAGPNCTTSSYALQTVLRTSPIPFESYYLPIGEGEYSSANFPLEPLLNNSSNLGESNDIWTYFTFDIPRGAAGRNIHIRLSSNTKINYEVYARFGGLPSVDIWDYYYANKTQKSDQSMFFMLYDSNDNNVDFYIIYAREGTWSFGLRHVNISSDSLKQKTIMSISLEGCPKQCSSHGTCKSSFDATGLTSYSICSCDRNHGGFDCSVEIVSHKGHILQSVFLIGSNAAAILPAFWALRQKAYAEWVIFTASGISSGIYHACDVGTWCALNFGVLQFMDFWLSFMAVISTFVYLATIDEVYKRAIHTTVFIFTALMSITNATRSSNIVLVIVIGALGLLIGWLIEMSTKYSLLTIKLWFYNLVKTLLRRFHWGLILAGFAALFMAGVSWMLETSDSYWIWHSFWHATIYTSSFFFLCSKANIVDAENQLPRSETYALTRQNSFSRE